MTATLPLTADPYQRHPAPRATMQVRSAALVIVLAVVVAALAGYGLGRSRSASGPHVLTGRAYVGQQQASVKVSGWAYGFGFSSNDLHWYDARGTLHDGGIPMCLQGPAGHYAWIRFGYSTATGPDGTGWRAVDWVQCLPHRP